MPYILTIRNIKEDEGLNKEQLEDLISHEQFTILTSKEEHRFLCNNCDYKIIVTSLKNQESTLHEQQIAHLKVAHQLQLTKTE